MADAGVIIKADLKGEDLTNKIDKLVKDVDSKFSEMAQKIDDNVQLIKLSLGELGSTAQAKVSEIKQAFTQLGTTFDQFARAMEKAAAAASGMGGRGGSGGNGGGSVNTYAPNTIGALEQEIAAGKALRKEAELYSDDLKEINNSIERQTRLLNQETKGQQKLTEEAKKTAQAQEKTRVRAAISMPTNDIQEVERKLLRLHGTLLRLQHTRLLDESQINRVKKAITTTEKQLVRLREQAAKPIMPSNITGVMGLSEKTLDQIAFKMKAISELRAKTPIGSADISRLNGEYARLSKLQTEILGKNAALVESNNALGRAFNYIRNRLAFTLTIGAFTGFVRQLYEIRGQYELLERSLGVLLDSFSKGSQIFNELNAMAIQSPFTLIELGTAAKQLTAYNFKATEVVNTTRRLADISAALGVPMERLVYNLGQIRAQTVLTARDARDFANAGLAIVPELAKHYTELQGKVVSTADVFDMMKKKAVSYNDVMSVLYKITDEGGKFFDFQAKQAGTLKVQLANLNLAWNNMLNDMGKSNQGLLSFPVQGLREAFLHWKDISNAITLAVGALGAYKLAQLAISKIVGVSNASLVRSAQAEARANMTRLQRIQLTRQLTQEEQVELAQSRFLVKSKQAMNQADYENMLAKVKLSKTQASQLVTMNKHNIALREALISTGMLTREEAANAMQVGKWSLMFQRAKISIQSFGFALKSALMTPATGILLLVSIIADVIGTWNEATEAVKQFNKSVSDGAKESLNSLNEFMKQYASVADSLYTWGENDKGKTVAINTQDINSEEAKRAWEALREEIIKSSAAGQDVVAELELISNINGRLRSGFNYVYRIKEVHGALEEISDDTIKVQQDWSKWWNLWTGYDSLKENLDDYMDSLKDVVELWGGVEEAQKKALNMLHPNQGAKNDLEELKDDLKALQGNLDETAESMVNLFAKKGFNPEQERAGFNQITNQLVEDLGLSVEQALAFRQQLEESYQKKRLELFKEENKANADDYYNQWIVNFGQRQQLEDEFLKWMVRNRYAATQEMFGNMSAQEIDHIDWSQPKFAEWARKNAEDFTKQYGLSFNDLDYLVKNANNYSIRIPVIFDFQNTEKSVFETLTNADSAADAAYKKIQRLREALQSGKLYGEQYKKALDELSAAETDYTNALKEGGKAQSANKQAAKNRTAAKRAQAKAESELQKALKDELQVIDKVQAAYKKLTKAGVSRDEALGIATRGFENTAKNINNVLKKYGIAQFDIKKFAGLSNPREMLKMLEDQLAKIKASGKSKPVEIKELEAQIDKIRVDAKEYDMKRITDGLNNELGKIKEEYELAVELDANPELGDMFAQAFGIDTTGFPNTVQEAVDMMQDSVDKAIAKAQFGEGIDIDPEDLMNTFDILRDDIDEWSKATGIALDSNVIESIKKMQKEARDLYAKDAKQTISDWQKLLEKYAEYETKRTEIQKQAEKERETARKHGASQEILDAIDLKEQRNLAKLDFDEFQKSATWITATGDLSNLTNKALQMLIDRLWEYKKAAKNLDPKDIIKLNNAMRKLRKEQKKDNPFAAFSISMDEAKQRMEQFEPDIQEIALRIESLKSKWAQQGFLDEKDKNQLKTLIELYQQLIKLQEEAGKMSLDDIINGVGKYISIAKELSSSFTNIANGLGGEGIKEAAEGLEDALKVIDKAESGAKIGGKWGAIAGALLGITEMIIKWSDNDKNIVDEITRQQRAVKELENQYKSLEHQIKSAYGTQIYAIQKAEMYNKKLQLDALEEQLRLEESRAAKHKDEDTIISLRGQIIDLKNEIHDMTTDIVNDMLGITSVGDMAENMVKSMIEAFKSGEDYMKVFEDSFEDMIDNMIMKAVVSRLIGDYINKVFDSIYANALESERAKQAERDIEIATKELNDLKNSYATGSRNKKPSTKGFATVEDAIAYWEQKLKEAQDKYAEAITPTPEDIATIREEIEYGKVGIKEGFEALMEAFGIRFGQNAGDAQLSALQQGIMGITEDTAGALEAYMNGVSQQVYLQSDLLTQIRDILINFGGDVTIATNAQILLQLQQSFQVQMTIQNVLTGVLNASGLAFRVEMV